MDNPFDRTNIGLRERPSSGDLNQLQSQIFRTMTELARMTFSGRASNSSSAMSSASGFLHDGMRVVPSSPAAMTVAVNSGFGFVHDPIDVVTNLGSPDLEQVNDLSAFKPLSLLTPITFAVPVAPGSPNSRIDIIEVKADRRLENSSTRRQLDDGTLSFLDHLFFKTLAFNLDGRTGVVTSPAASTAGISYKIGTAANPGLVPSTTPGYVKIAEVRVPNGTTSITGLNIVDRRRLFGTGGLVRASARVMVQRGGGAQSVPSIVSINAPPGVDIGVAPYSYSAEISSGQGCFVLYLAAGDFTRAVRHVTVDSPQTGGIGNQSGTSVIFTPSSGSGGVAGADGIVTIDSTFQPEAAIAGVPLGLGQVAARFVSDGRTVYIDTAGVSSIHDAQLNLLFFNVSYDLAYH